jgi:hypothetical protein
MENVNLSEGHAGAKPVLTDSAVREALSDVVRGAFCWAVTGTVHGSIIEAETEGEARRIFHKHYNGESITHIKKRNVPAWSF